MDHSRFDDLSRRLAAATTRRGGIKAALGALLGTAAGAAALEAGARGRDRRGNDADAGRKKRRKKCSPACGSGFDCVKGQCTCATGLTCGDACCRIGQVCEGGACVPEPEPGQCIAAGQPCKGAGRACCDGRVCASGQGGLADVACYAPKTGACAATADCVYGMACVDGRCAPPAPVERLGGACDATSQQLCAYPGATCTDYSAAGAPGGSYCTLPVGATCTGDPDCTCYKCFYPNGSVAGGSRGGRASANTKACCFPAGHECQSESQCCTGLSCVNGTCGGTLCAPAGGECKGDGDCCAGSCSGNVCSSAPACAPTFAIDSSDPAGNGTKLQAAIDAMQPGDTLYLAPGIYQSTTQNYFEFSKSRGHLHQATYTLARCGTGEVVLRDKSTGQIDKALYISGTLAGTYTTDVRFTVVLQDITIGSKFDPAADPTKCATYSDADNNGIRGGGVEISRGELVLAGTSKITGACNSNGGLYVSNTDSTALLKDDALITGNVGWTGGGSGGANLESTRPTLILQDRAKITGNYGMGTSGTTGGIVVDTSSATVTGATAQNVFGNFAPNQQVSPSCLNYYNDRTDTCVLP